MRSNCASIRRVLTCLQKDSWSASCVYLFIFYSLEFPLRPHQQIFTRKYIHNRFSRKTFLELNTWVKYNYIYIQNIENKLHCSLFYGKGESLFLNITFRRQSYRNLSFSIHPEPRLNAQFGNSLHYCLNRERIVV